MIIVDSESPFPTLKLVFFPLILYNIYSIENYISKESLSHNQMYDIPINHQTIEGSNKFTKTSMKYSSPTLMIV